jgi:hypothetical protein
VRAGHEHPAEAGETAAVTISNIPYLRPVSQGLFQAYFLPWGCLCPRLTSCGLGTAYRDCIFAMAGIADAVAMFDGLEKDTMFLRAANETLAEFAAHTAGDPPVKYRDLISPDRQIRLLTLVKGQRECQE